MRILYTIILSAVILFFVFLTYASILGENNRIDEVVNGYFENIKNRKFSEASQFLSKEQKDVFSKNNFSDLSFLLELSLLEKYNLMEQSNYKIKFKRSQFWLPFINRDKIGVGVLLEDVEKQGVFERFSFKQRSDYVENLILVKREGGSWRIVDIDIDNPGIKDAYKKFKSLLNENMFYKMTSDRSIELLHTKINLDDIRPYERRILTYIFRGRGDIL